MDLVVEMCNTRSIHWCGISGRQLGKLSPGASLLLPLTIFSSVQGLQVRSQPSTSAFHLFCSNTDFFLVVSEHFWTQTHRHVSEEDLRIRRHCTSVCDLSVHQQRMLVTFTFLLFLHFRMDQLWNCALHI